jgi:hypothetical protein
MIKTSLLVFHDFARVWSRGLAKTYVTDQAFKRAGCHLFQCDTEYLLLYEPYCKKINFSLRMIIV